MLNRRDQIGFCQKISHEISERIFATAVGFVGLTVILGGFGVLRVFVALSWGFSFVIIVKIPSQEARGVERGFVRNDGDSPY
jgi:hypothetical protein